MENATKALVIAGAVLVTILLISVGITIFNSAKSPLDDASNNTASYAIDQFNSKFNGYLGEKVKGSNVKSLLNEVRSSNATNETHQIKINGSETVPSNNTYSSSKTYAVDAEYGADAGNKGYIVNITINDATSKK